MKKVLFGGTFDPVHNGHVAIVNLLSDLYDRVIVMPAAVSPFKSSKRASDADRLAMLDRVFGSMDRVVVDRYEIEKGGVSYTYETLQKYSDCDFAVGGDSMLTLPTWKNAEQIRKNTRIVVVDRAETSGEERAVEEWNRGGGNAVLIGKAPLASSSLARLRLALERKCDFMPTVAVEYCKEHLLYREWDDVLALYRRFHLKETRIAHSIRVAYTAAELALRLNVDFDTTVRAALLHDIAKYVSISEAEQLGVKVGSLALHAAEGVVHAYLGAEIAKQVLHESEEIVDAVRWHTTGKPNMSQVTAIVCLADYIEPGRSFEGLQEIRDAAKHDLDLAVYLMLKKTMEYLNGAARVIDPMTQEAYRYYKEKTERNTEHDTK